MKKNILSILIFICTICFTNSVFAISSQQLNKGELDLIYEECELALKEVFIEILEECIDKIPKEERLKISKYKSFSLDKKGEYKKAIDYYLEFLDLNSGLKDNVKYSIYLANIYVVEAEFYKAIQYYSNAFYFNKNIKNRYLKNINNAQIKIGISNIFQYLNKDSLVILQYKEVIDILRDTETKEAKKILNEAYYNLSILYAKRKNLEEALNYAEMAYTVAHDNDYLLGMGYAKKVKSYIFLLQGKSEYDKDVRDLVNSSNEIFTILDIKDSVFFSLELLKINIYIENEEFDKAKEKISYLENQFESAGENLNYLKLIYNTFYKLYFSKNNQVGALYYKWKEIEVDKQIRNKQNVQVILRFKNEFQVAEDLQKNTKLQLEQIEKEREIQEQKNALQQYNIYIYVILSLLLVALCVILYFVIVKRKHIRKRRESDIKSINSGKDVWGADYFYRNSRNVEEEKFSLIGYNILGLEENISHFSSKDKEDLNLYIENVLKSSLRRGDILFKHEDRLFILAASNLDESYFIAHRLKEALKKNQYVKDNVYFACVNRELHNSLKDSIKFLDLKLSKGIKKHEHIMI